MTAGPANGSSDPNPRRRQANASLPSRVARSVSVASLSKSIIQHVQRGVPSHRDPISRQDFRLTFGEI
jgi:hypothetical protein